MKRIGMLALVALAGIACEEPEGPDPAVIETVYLLDRVNGEPPPAEVCAQDAVEQTLVFESIALADDDTYGRLQQSSVGDGPVVEQQEFGDYVRSDSTILLINAGDDTLTLAFVDDEGAHVRRVHACGDTLRYADVPVE